MVWEGGKQHLVYPLVTLSFYPVCTRVCLCACGFLCIFQGNFNIVFTATSHESLTCRACSQAVWICMGYFPPLQKSACQFQEGTCMCGFLSRFVCLVNFYRQGSESYRQGLSPCLYQCLFVKGDEWSKSLNPPASLQRQGGGAEVWFPPAQVCLWRRRPCFPSRPPCRQEPTPHRHHLPPSSCAASPKTLGNPWSVPPPSWQPASLRGSAETSRAYRQGSRNIQGRVI